MTPEEFTFIADLVRQETAVILHPDKGFFIETRLGPVARREKEPGVSALIERVRERPTPELVKGVVEATLMPETSFFRNRAAFVALAQGPFAEIAARRGQAGLRILSAGCATGQEAYSMAILAEELAHRVPVEIVALDYSDRSLEKARTGLYSHFEIQRGLSIRRLLDHFTQVEDNWRASPKLRQMIDWREMNLTEDLSGLGRFDVIACRYVLNAFLPKRAGECFERLETLLADDGVMMVGAREEATLPASLTNLGSPGLYGRTPLFARPAKAG